jgi:hypothetical protein
VYIFLCTADAGSLKYLCWFVLCPIARVQSKPQDPSLDSTLYNIHDISAKIKSCKQNQKQKQNTKRLEEARSSDINIYLNPQPLCISLHQTPRRLSRSLLISRSTTQLLTRQPQYPICNPAYSATSRTAYLYRFLSYHASTNGDSGHKEQTFRISSEYIPKAQDKKVRATVRVTVPHRIDPISRKRCISSAAALGSREGVSSTEEGKSKIIPRRGKNDCYLTQTDLTQEQNTTVSRRRYRVQQSTSVASPDPAKGRESDTSLAALVDASDSSRMSRCSRLLGSRGTALRTLLCL